MIGLYLIVDYISRVLKQQTCFMATVPGAGMRYIGEIKCSLSPLPIQLPAGILNANISNAYQCLQKLCVIWGQLLGAVFCFFHRIILILS